MLLCAGRMVGAVNGSGFGRLKPHTSYDIVFIVAVNFFNDTTLPCMVAIQLSSNSSGSCSSGGWQRVSLKTIVDQQWQQW